MLSRVQLLIAFLLTVSGAWWTAQNSIGPDPATRVVHIVLSALLALCLASQIAGMRQGSARRVACLAAAFLAGEAALGLFGRGGMTEGQAVAHAILATITVALIAAVPELLATTEPPATFRQGKAIRTISRWLPPVTLIQIAMGALYRHKVQGVLPHMGGALLVALPALIASTLLLQNAPLGTSIRRAGVITISVVLAQASLGIAAFVMRVLDADNSVFFALIAALHVTVGSAVLAAVSVLAIRAQKIALGESQ
jgi:hypothetical protein